MTRSALVIAMAIVLLGSTALAEQPLMQSSGAQQPRQESVNGASGDWQAADSNRDTTNRSDERFLKDFAQFNAAEVELAKTAEWKAEDAEVKAFATHAIDTHSKTVGKVKTVAAMTSIDVKARPAFMQKAKSAFLDINVGASFDRAYMKAMVSGYEEIIEILETEIKDGQDANVKQLASEALSDARTHLQVAQELRARVYADQNARRSLPRTDSNSAERVATNR